ncbi:MAG: DUF615 domain-containing protein [Deltaproteobacteria bacterium]|nr:DUF615 domain-containing protein [Deltaproteobacteria bacterium]
MARPPWRPGNRRPQLEPEPDLPPGVEAPPSRTEKKTEAHKTRDLAAELVALALPDLAAVPLEPALREQVELARRITKHGGRRRQLQYVAKYLRTVDTAPILEAITRLRLHRHDHTLRTHAVETWRRRLLREGTAALDALVAEFPAIDREALETLVEQAQREAAAGQEKRRQRELFRVLAPFIGGG